MMYTAEKNFETFYAALERQGPLRVDAAIGVVIDALFLRDPSRRALEFLGADRPILCQGSDASCPLEMIDVLWMRRARLIFNHLSKACGGEKAALNFYKKHAPAPCTAQELMFGRKSDGEDWTNDTHRVS